MRSEKDYCKNIYSEERLLHVMNDLKYADKKRVFRVYKDIVIPYLREYSCPLSLDQAERSIVVALKSYNLIGCRCSSDFEFNDFFYELHHFVDSSLNYIINQYAFLPSESIKEEVSFDSYIRVGFVVDSNNEMEQWIALANEFSKIERVKVFVYFLSETEENIVFPMVKDIVYKHINFNFSGDRLVSDLNRIKEETDRDRLSMVFNSLSPVWSFILYKMNLAKINVFSSSIMHPAISNCGVNIFCTWGSYAFIRQKYFFNNWFVFPSLLREDSFHTEKSFTKSENRIVLCTIGSTEHIMQPEFLNALQMILIQNEKTEFWYSSDSDMDPVRDFFANSSVLSRIRSIEHKEYNNAIPCIDIYLDSFPVSGRNSILYAMRNEKPVISLCTENSLFGRDIIPMIEIFKEFKNGIYRNDRAIDYSIFSSSKVQETMESVLSFSEFFMIDNVDIYVKECLRNAEDSTYKSKCGRLMHDLFITFYKSHTSIHYHLKMVMDSLIEENDAVLNVISPQQTLPEPWSLINVTAIFRCVNRCVFCLQSYPSFKPVIRIQSEEDFIKALDEAPQSMQLVGVSTYAETLSCKEDIIRRVQISLDKGLLPAFETSNVLYDEDFYKTVFNLGLNRVLVSINAPTRELYKMVAQRDWFDRVIENTNKLIELRNRTNPSTKILIHIMLFGEFMDEYHNIYKMFKDKVDHIYLQGLCNWGDDKWNVENYRNANVTPLKMKKNRYPCPSLYSSILLHPDGNYYACGMSYNQYINEKPIAMLGNAKNTSLMEAWKRLTYYRDKHEEGKWNELECCRNCNAWLNWTLYLDNVRITDDGYVEVIDET